jgi:uncharacterized protein (TIGR04222 family)
MLHIAADTWGIKSQSFLILYLGVCVVGAVALVAWRSAILGQARRVRAHPTDYELAMLNGGPGLAVTAAAAKLRGESVLEPGDARHALRVDLSAYERDDPLERELLETAAHDPQTPFRHVRAAVARGPAAQEMATRLAKQGLMLTPARRAQLGRLWLWGLPVFVLGVARLIAGVNNHKPVGDLTVILFVVAIGIFNLRARGRWTTRAGEEVLQSRRVSQRGWTDRPGQITPALAVALFGGAALWAIDPTFAAATAMPRGAVAGWSTWSQGGGGCGGSAGSGGFGGFGGGCGGGGGGCGGGGGGCGG